MSTEDAAIDLFGCAISAPAGDADMRRATAAWNRTALGFLAHAADTADHLADALDAAPALPVAEAVKGLFLMLLGRPELTAAAQSALAAARAAPRPTDRERALTAALGDYLDGRLDAAADRLDAALSDAPHDAVLLKMVHAVRFVIGDSAGMRASVEAALPAYGDDHPARGYVLGCRAFALEETGAYLDAERAGRRAVEIAPDDAWGLHAVAHVYDMTGRAGAGVAWLRERVGAWAHCNNFRHHVWWHLALFHLDRGQTAETLALYDDRVRAEKTDDYRDISNAASLLARLELDGVDVGARWDELAALAEARVEDGCVVFADLHYALALKDRPAAQTRMLTALRAASVDQSTAYGRTAGSAGAAAVVGLAAFARGDYGAAWRALDRAAPAMQGVGGSHAQRDVFERIRIDAALRAGLLTEARRGLQDRLRRRGAMDGYAARRLGRIAELSGVGVVAAE